jgi:hypothetical protein
VDGDLDAVAVAGEVFVDRVVQHLEDAVVKTALVGVSDIHAGALADGLKTFEFVDLGGIVLLLAGDLGGGLLGLVRVLGHRAGKRSEIPAGETRNFFRKKVFLTRRIQLCNLFMENRL